MGLRGLLQLAMLVVILVPMALGPATAPFARALGAIEDHTCACGMKPGKCGCPECERLEQARHDDLGRRLYGAFRATCDDDDVAPPPVAAPYIVPAALAVPGAPRVDVLLALAPRALDPLYSNGPPTPPPRASRS